METGHVPRESLVSTINDVAVTYIGEVMSHAVSTGPLRRLGLDAERLTAQQVEMVMTAVENSLKVFAGDKAAARAVSEVRRRLGLA